MRNQRTPSAIVVALAATATLSAAAVLGACGPSAPEEGERLRVVAAFSTLAEMAERVGGDDVAVTNLTPAGAEPHDLELGTKGVDAILDADVVLYVGGGFQPAIEEVADRTEGVAIDVLPKGAEDPHVWLDPVAFVKIVDRLRDALIELRPDDRDTFRITSTEYVRELEALDVAYERGLATCERRTIVTTHAAFGHLAARYDLDERSIAGSSPEAEPDPSRLAALADDVAAEGVTTVFTEPLAAPDVAETLAREAGVRTAVLDPIESIAAGDTYRSVMRDNLAALRAALGCTGP